MCTCGVSLHVCVCAPVCMHVCGVYTRVYICVCMCTRLCTSVLMYAHTCVCANVCTHMCNVCSIILLHRYLRLRLCTHVLSVCVCYGCVLDIEDDESNTHAHTVKLTSHYITLHHITFCSSLYVCEATGGSCDQKLW